MSKEFMKRYTLQRDPSKIESIYSDEKIGCEMDFVMQMAFESMRESFAKQSDEAIIDFLIKKYRDTNVSDVFVFSETDFKQFIIEMVPKWRNEKAQEQELHNDRRTMTNREWLSSLSDEDFVKWLLNSENWNGDKYEQPYPKLETLKYMSTSTERYLTEWLKENRSE